MVYGVLSSLLQIRKKMDGFSIAGKGEHSEAALARVRDRLRHFTPFAILVGSAGALFLANILAKNIMTPEQFIEWAYLTSLVTFFFSFSLLGSEQLIMRSAKVDGGALLMPVQSARLILVSFFAFLVFYVLVLDGRLFAYRLGKNAIPVILCVGIIQLVYQIERAQGHLANAQFSLNTWKYALLCLVFIIPAAGITAEIAVIIALLVGIVPAIVLIARTRKCLGIKDIQTDAGRIFLPFMLSLGAMAILGIADRIVLEKIQSPGVFAAYVYMATILATPFNILAGYFGFKEAVRYRTSCSPQMVRSDVLRTLSLATILVIGWSVLCYSTRTISNLPFDPSVWSILGFLSILRCGYGVVSAAMNIRGSPFVMYVGNAVTVVALVVFGYVALQTRASIQSSLLGYTAVWSTRFFLFSWFLVGHRNLAPA